MLVLRSLHQLLQAASFESSGQCFSPFVVTVFILKDLLIYIFVFLPCNSCLQIVQNRVRGEGRRKRGGGGMKKIVYLSINNFKKEKRMYFLLCLL